MALRTRALLRAALVVLALFALAPATAFAALDRPNALDKRVDAIPAATLLAQPATQLVDSARQAAAVRLAHLRLPGWIAQALLQALGLWYFWRAGWAAALRDRLRRALPREGAVRFLFGATLALVARVAAIPAAFYLYRLDRIMGLSVELTRSWAMSWILGTLLAMLVAGTIALIVLWLVDRTHQWYVFTIVFILAASVAWAYALPYFQIPGAARAVPVSGPIAGQLDALLGRAGLAGMPVLVQHSRNSPVGGAVVQGLGASRRVVLSDTLLAGDTPPEVLYEVAYEIGHIVHNDPAFEALIEGGIVIVFAALAVVVADRIGFRRDDDPLSRLALVGALLAIVYLGAVPARNAALRSYDFDADRYAVALTGDRAAAVRSLVRESDQHMEEICPETFASFFLATHPGAGERIAAVNGVPNGCP